MRGLEAIPVRQSDEGVQLYIQLGMEDGPVPKRWPSQDLDGARVSVQLYRAGKDGPLLSTEMCEILAPALDGICRLQLRAGIFPEVGRYKFTVTVTINNVSWAVVEPIWFRVIA